MTLGEIGWWELELGCCSSRVPNRRGLKLDSNKSGSPSEQSHIGHLVTVEPARMLEFK